MNIFSLLLNETGGFSGKFGSQLAQCFLNFSLLDALDIILLGLFFFFAFRFIRGRKAGVLLIGILIFFSIQFLAFVFELNATYFIFSQMFKVGAIAIVIIFQPEIRDALEKIGSGSLTGLLSFGDQKKKRQLYSVA